MTKLKTKLIFNANGKQLSERLTLFCDNYKSDKENKGFITLINVMRVSDFRRELCTDYADYIIIYNEKTAGGFI